MKHAKLDERVKIAASFNVFACTVSGGDVVFMPPGWVSVEKTHNMDVIGVRLLMAARCFEAELRQLDTWMLATGKQDPKVSLALDSIVGLPVWDFG